MNSDKTVFAAIDIGTTQIKLGVYSSLLSPAFQIIGYRNTEVHYDSENAVCHYTSIRESVNGLMKELSQWLSPYSVESLHIGICGLVSSYLIWDKDKMGPVNDAVPIWLDRSCGPSVKKLFNLLANGKDIKMLGTHLPQGTNWLLSKIYHQKNKKLQKNQLYLQLGDAIFAELTGEIYTHFSSQVSIAHNVKQNYSKEALKLISISEEQLPAINNKSVFPIHASIAARYSLPSECFVVPALADFYASFLGVGLKRGEGFILANTSEIAGKVVTKAVSSKKFVSVKANGFHLLYGSTNTGGNVINWIVRNILKKELNAETFAQLNKDAAHIHPDDTPLFIPFIDGERSPHWNQDLTGTFAGVKSFHSAAHLYRAALEGVAFCRRFQIEAMPGKMPEKITICGGSTKNDLLNKIRATVLNRKLHKSTENELAIYGTIRHSMELCGFKMIPSDIGHEVISPDSSLIKVYNKKYIAFKNLQSVMLKYELETGNLK